MGSTTLPARVMPTGDLCKNQPKPRHHEVFRNFLAFASGFCHFHAIKWLFWVFFGLFQPFLTFFSISGRTYPVQRKFGSLFML